MPEITYKRSWCKKCNSWELFQVHFNTNDNPATCENCGTEFEAYKLSEVPEDKILEQRERYKQYKKGEYEKLFQTYLSMGSLSMDSGFFTESAPRIIEADAGQKEINKKAAEERQKRKEALQKEYEDYAVTFKPLNRNDKCACGSGKKYKQCCLPKFRQKRFC